MSTVWIDASWWSVPLSSIARDGEVMPTFVVRCETTFAVLRKVSISVQLEVAAGVAASCARATAWKNSAANIKPTDKDTGARRRFFIAVTSPEWNRRSIARLRGTRGNIRRRACVSARYSVHTRDVRSSGSPDGRRGSR